MSNIQQTIEEFKNRIDTVVSDTKLKLVNEIGLLLDKSDKIDAIQWTQYTPYFNDGDETVFSVNTDLYVKLINSNEFEWGDCLTNVDGEILTQITDLLDSIKSEFMLLLFGNHVEISVDRLCNVEINDYDHD